MLQQPSLCAEVNKRVPCLWRLFLNLRFEESLELLFRSSATSLATSALGPFPSA